MCQISPNWEIIKCLTTRVLFIISFHQFRMKSSYNIILFWCSWSENTKLTLLNATEFVEACTVPLSTGSCCDWRVGEVPAVVETCSISADQAGTTLQLQLNTNVRAQVCDGIRINYVIVSLVHLLRFYIVRSTPPLLVKPHKIVELDPQLDPLV
jgi:hypothetical protein